MTNTHHHSLARLICSGVLFFAATSLPAADPAAKPKAKDPSIIEVSDEPGLPRVFLIGDSISMGYTVPVRELLKGKANVHRPLTNGGPTPNGLKNLDHWLGDGKWDVIHFNWGLHDLKWCDDKGTITEVGVGHQQVSVENYEKNLRTLVARLKKTGAKLIWCSTTPVPEGAKGRATADVVKYNEAAARVMKDEGVPTDDLYAFVLPKQAAIQNPKDVHYSKAGYEELAKQVVSTIEPLLPKTK